MAEFKAREALLKLVAANGWVQDEYTWVPTRYGRDSNLDPFSFVKDASFGGQWLILLDYQNWSSYSRSTDGLLRGVKVIYVGPDTTINDGSAYTDGRPRREGFTVVGELKNTDKGRYQSTSWLWEALKGNGKTLRGAAELLIKDVELALWLSFEAQHAEDVKRAARRAEERTDRELRNRPLPITVDQDGYTNDWWKLTNALEGATNVVKRADGKTDLPQALAKVYLAYEAIIEALTPEAAAELENHLWMNKELTV